MEILKEKWSGKISEITIGATAQEGGTRSSKIMAGGESTLPFLIQEGGMPNPPVIAMEVLDSEPADWPEALKEPFKKVLKDPVEWALVCQNEFKASLLCLKLAGAHPDSGNRTPDQCAELVKNILKKVSVPLVILGCGDDDKDNLVLPKVSEAAKGERCLLGDVTEKNYKTLVASCIADGHNIIAESPIDVNIAKQVNILISEMGFPLDKIVINPTIGALGYGMEYAYSIMERARCAALIGDKMLAMPFICFVGQEAWRAKEAKTPVSLIPEWGDENRRGILWEAATATCMLQAGADILIMRHPKAIEATRSYINKLMKKGE